MSILKRTVLFLLLLCFCLVVLISNILYHKIQKYHLEQRKDYLNKLNEKDAEDMEVDIMLHKFQKTYSIQDKILDMSKMIKHINEKQRIYNSKRFSQVNLKFENTVLVIKVHDNIRHLAVFLDSIRRMKLVTKSLLIFAHDFYNIEINSLLRRLPFARIMQVFYPYSIQLYPNIYPGRDSKFCHEMNQCISSNKRNVTLAQNKLFWWWVASYVFDHIEVLKNYDGYIYFLETEQYLTSDFIHMATMLEQLLPLFCPECRILSLAASLPRPEVYKVPHNKLVAGVWGKFNYSSALGFNRRTWNEIRLHKQQFCYFNDSSWEYSLQHLASKTPQKLFLTLSAEGPRAFPTTGCGAFRNGTNCTLDINFMDILDFTSMIREGLFPTNFKLKVDDNERNATKVVEGRGQWEDARDRELCMFIASRSSRVYY